MTEHFFALIGTSSSTHDNERKFERIYCKNLTQSHRIVARKNVCKVAPPGPPLCFFVFNFLLPSIMYATSAVIAGALIASLAVSTNVYAARDGMRLLQFGPSVVEWVPAAAVDLARSDDADKLVLASSDLEELVLSLGPVARHALFAQDGRHFGPGFIDVTAYADQVHDLIQPQVVAEAAFPTVAVHEALVFSLMDKLNSTGLRDIVDKLSNDFVTRHHKSKYAALVPQWIKKQLDQIVSSSGRADLEVTLFQGKGTNQPSVVATIKGSGELAEEVVIVGGHEDSTSSSFWDNNARAPGAGKWPEMSRTR
jgi:hypothetical protein